jgi:hypothetical protein
VANLNDDNNPRSYSLPDIYPANTPISITGTSWKESLVVQYSWNSSSASSYIKVLRDGDAVPTIPGLDEQPSIADFVAGYVVDGKMSLAANQAIYLFELGVTDLSSSGADFQDLVALVTLAKAAVDTEEETTTTESTLGTSATFIASVIGCQPDLLVGETQTGPFVGESDIAASDETQQPGTVAAPLDLGTREVDSRSTLEYFLKLENDGGVADDFVLKQEQSSHQSWIARYYDLSNGSQEVTDQVQSETGWVASDNLLPAESKIVRLVVVPGARATVPEGENPDELSLTVKACSNGDEARQDVVKMSVVKQKGRLRIVDYGKDRTGTSDNIR